MPYPTGAFKPSNLNAGQFKGGMSSMGPTNISKGGMSSQGQIGYLKSNFPGNSAAQKQIGYLQRNFGR